MKLFLPIVLALPILAVSAAADDPPAQDPVTAYQAVEVTDNVVMAVHAHGSNITCIRHGDGLVFVDASLSTRLAARFRSDMEQRFGLPARALVLSHAHMDHVLGMGAFADVPVIAAAPGRAFMERLATFEWDERSIAGYTQIFPTFNQVIGDAKPFLPTVWFDDEHQLGTADDPLLARRTGGHSACSANVWWPRAGVVVAGDLVQSGRRPYFGDPTTDLAAWMAALQ
jgi:glyoxylase-like metal-dependent hydrolase (beta-lactamase superfamily II)